MSLGNAEKDYVLSVALAALAEAGLNTELVFKGGTCLKKAYFPEYRFSADLDFTALASDITTHKRRITGLFENREIEGVAFTGIKDRSQAGRPSLNLRVKYASGLAPPERPHIDSIRLDLNYQATVYLEPTEQRLLLPEIYQLSRPGYKVLQLTEIVAEKVHAIYKRPKPRDLFDLNYLLEKGVEFDIKLIDLKLETLKRTFDTATFAGRVERLKPRWSRDMEGLITDPPSFANVSASVMAHVAK